MDNTPIVSPQKIATRIGFKIGSIVEVSDAVTGETRSNPLDKNTYDNPNCTIPNTRTYPQTVGVNTVSRIKMEFHHNTDQMRDHKRRFKISAREFFDQNTPA